MKTQSCWFNIDSSLLKKTTLTLFNVVLILSACKKTPQEAGFTADKTAVYIGEPVHFTDNGEMRKNAHYFYDYGDGSNSENDQSASSLSYWYYGSGYYGNTNENSNSTSNRNPTHIYLFPGTFTVTQTITFAKNLEKGKNKITSYSITITVLPIEANFTPSTTIASVGDTASVGEVVTFTNTTSNADKTFLYYWGYGWGWQAVNIITLQTLSEAGGGILTVPQNGTSGLTDAYITFPTSGTWKVTLSISTGAYINSKTIDITIN